MASRLVALSLLILAGLAAGGAGAPDPALRQLDADQQEREHERDIARAEADAAHIEAAQLEAQLAELNAGALEGDKTVGEKRLKLAALNVREAELNARLGGNQGQLSRLLGALELLRAEPAPGLFVDPRDIRDSVRAAILIRAIAPELERRAKALRAEALDLKQLRRQAAAASEDLFTSESDVADRRAKIESLLAAKVAAEHQASAQAAAAGMDADALAARANGLRNQARGSNAPLPPSIAPPLDPEHAGPSGRPKLFTAPVAGAPTLRFGQPQFDGRTHAAGWTWRPAPGAQIVAPAAGVVEYAEPLKGWGLVLILELGGGYRLVLAGLDAPLVSTGQKVDQGQPVGRMAADGKDPAEFYFEIRKNGALVDPAHWLSAPASIAGKH